jgi:hypothetical protein
MEPHESNVEFYLSFWVLSLVYLCFYIQVLSYTCSYRCEDEQYIQSGSHDDDQGGTSGITSRLDLGTDLFQIII